MLRELQGRLWMRRYRLGRAAVLAVTMAAEKAAPAADVDEDGGVRIEEAGGYQAYVAERQQQPLTRPSQVALSAACPTAFR